MKISVAIAYYNRKQHLINSLWSMSKSVHKDFEVIVADDGSDDIHRIDDLEKQFSFLKVFRIDKDKKIHINSCVPYNLALSNTTGEIIILQCPECFHYDDIFEHAANNVAKNTYLAYSVVNKDVVNTLKNINWDNDYSLEINKLIKIDHNEGVNNKWYCHGKFRRGAAHFCTAITRDDMKELNGFDERFANGIEYEDTELLRRINRKKMNIVFVDNVSAIHQSHTPFYYINPNFNKLKMNNYNLYYALTNHETIIKANPNKIIIK